MTDTKIVSIDGAIGYVDFQLNNIKGYLSIKDKESALIKCKYLKDAVNDLEQILKKQQIKS